MAMGGSTNTVCTQEVAHEQCQLFHATHNGLAQNAQHL